MPWKPLPLPNLTRALLRAFLCAQPLPLPALAQDTPRLGFPVDCGPGDTR